MGTEHAKNKQASGDEDASQLDAASVSRIYPLLILLTETKAFIFCLILTIMEEMEVCIDQGAPPHTHTPIAV